MGHEVTLAFRDSAFLENGRAEGFETFIAPLLHTQREMSPSPLNFSDILLNIGYGDVRGVAGALRAWRSMLEMLAPDVVVADYAPTALIAASLASIKTVTVGTGFSVPAAGDPIPDLRPWSPTDPNILRALDDRLLTTVRRAAGQAGVRLPARAGELFKGHLDLMCTFPEIDPFGPRDGVEYVGPQGDATSGVEVRWTGAKKTRVFAYLKPRSPRFELTLAGLASLDAETIVAAPGLDAERAKRASSESMRVIGSAVNLDLVLPDASLCVSHAGPGVAARAMAVGVPMALLPLHLEQFLIAKRIEKSGAAIVSNPEEPPPEYRRWISGFLSQDNALDASKRLRERYHDHDFAQATARAARRIADMAAL